jgi:hypothetical protein
MEAIDKAINDAKLHKNEAEREIRNWQVRLDERLRQLTTLEILKDKK